MKKRCVNLDWLELHAYEPVMTSLNAAYFRSKGYHVEEREYGTRVYKEMFTILDNHGYGMIEIRRNPSSQGENGIHQFNECHIRLTNRTCYFDNAADLLHDFVTKHDYYHVRISRVDICMDFSTFDKGDDPQAFVRRYFEHRYSKINQGRIHSHGEDTWTGQEWNSLSWGSKSSAVTTKLYDKTMELYNAKLGTYKKPYIRESWRVCNLIDDIDRCTLNGEQQRIWRVEFSLTSAVRNWIAIELDGKERNYQSLQNTLDVYSSRDRILVMFASLARHYFRFKYYEKEKRKDRCKDKILFDFKEVECTYKIGRPNSALGTGDARFTKWNRLLTLLEQYRPQLANSEQINACNLIMDVIRDEVLRGNLVNPFSHEELKLLKAFNLIKADHPEFSFEVIQDMVKRYLHIGENTLPKPKQDDEQKAVQ